MKKQLLLVASCLLLASCGNADQKGTGLNPGQSSEPEVISSRTGGEAVTDLATLKAPLNNLATKLAATKKLGAKVVGFENLDASIHTVANQTAGTHDATYTMKENFGIELNAGIDFAKAQAYAEATANLDIDAKLPSPVTKTVVDSELDWTFQTLDHLEDKDFKINVKNASAKCFIDGGYFFGDLGGMKEAYWTVFNAYVGFAGLEVPSNISSLSDPYFQKVKTNMGREATASIQSVPAMIGGYLAQVTPYLDMLNSEDYSSAIKPYLDLLSVQKFADGDYQIKLDVDANAVWKVVKPMIAPQAETNQTVAIIEQILGLVTAKVTFGITFSETALKNIGFEFSLAVKDLDPHVFIPAEQSSNVVMPLDKINVSSKLGLGIEFSYDDAVTIKTLTDAEKAQYEEINMGGGAAIGEEDF